MENRPIHTNGNEVAEDMPTPTSKRTTSPAYQHYASNFLSDDKVCRMSYTEIGIYQVLLDHSWLARGLPNKTSEIAKMLKLPLARFEKLWAGALSECFVERKGRLVNPRLELEREKQEEYRRRQSDNGSKGGRPPKSQHQAVGYQSLSSGKARVMKTEDPSGVVLDSEKKRPLEIDGQQAFMAFQAEYPKNRRKGGYLAQSAYFEQLALAGGPDVLMAALANHILSEQWANPEHIPGMDTWLTEERWRQELPIAGSASARESDRRLPAWAR